MMYVIKYYTFITRKFTKHKVTTLETPFIARQCHYHKATEAADRTMAPKNKKTVRLK
jgi:hypothetical protein